jgi:hypothetical protein
MLDFISFTFENDEVGPALLPSERYPSDHLAIAADLQLLWFASPTQ